MTNLTNVDGIRKKHVERTTEKRVPARLPTVLCDPDFRSDAAAVQIFRQEPDGPEFQVTVEDFQNLLRLRLIDLEAAIRLDDYRRASARPHRLRLRDRSRIRRGCARAARDSRPDAQTHDRMKHSAESSGSMRCRRAAAPKRRFAFALAAIEAVMDRAVASGKYLPGDTWRERSVTEHLHHAVGHLRKLQCGDSSDPHLEHAATRILMALENQLIRDRERGYGTKGGGGR